MIDLSGIARHLRLPVEQIRVAADLIEQGYSPTFIERYRGDETHSLPSATVWKLKFEIDRRKRLEAAKSRAISQLPKDSVLDSEADRALKEATSAVAVDTALRSFRSRRSLEQSQERDGAAGRLLEAMLSYSGAPVADLNAWVAEQFAGEDVDADPLLSQAKRLVSSLVHCDTTLNAKLRHFVERYATLRVEDVAVPATNESTGAEVDARSANEASSVNPSDAEQAERVDVEHGLAGDESADADEHFDAEGHADLEAHTDTESHTDEAEQVASDTEGVEKEAESQETIAHQLTSMFKESNDSKSAGDQKSKSKKRTVSLKTFEKLTPRQRRRRWLTSVLAPMRSIKKPLQKLTAYQVLMLGRGSRSQLIATVLDYDTNGLVELARNSFADAKHPFADWFRQAVTHALDHGLRAKVESDALAELEERASEHLLEHATEDLQRQLMRRPVRGHTIALIDTVGPKSVTVVFVDSAGRVLGCEELTCSAQPEAVTQNVNKLGEWVHRHRATLVAVTNGPGRRFMVVTLREFMKQSKDSGLRWTMADRSGAEAYAAGRVGLKELPSFNRRQRAAIWAARCLQDPLVELLKVDLNRLRLGGYQRELPQEPLKKLIEETIADCVCARGIDTQNASEQELQFVPGVQAEQARKIFQLAQSGTLFSRSQLANDVDGWPDADKRHAIGWLRVFGSENPLDATLVHPDDYYLAQRLIDGTEILAPPAAPPGWGKRKLTVELPSSSAQPPSTDDPSASEEVVATDDASPSVQASVEDEPVGESATAGSFESLEQSDASEPTESAETDATAVPSEELSETSTVDAATETPSEPPLIAEAGPEYPEQIVVTPPSSNIPIDCEKLANQWSVGRAKLKSIAGSLFNPFGDPRLVGVPIPLHDELPTLESLQPDTCVWAVVVGVADFGVFVELGPNCNGLIHISRLSQHFIEDPHQCVQIGDLILTWVVDIEHKKNRVSLTALSPAQREQLRIDEEARKALAGQEREHRGRRGNNYGGGRGAQHGSAQGPSNRAEGSPQQGQARSGRDRRAGSGNRSDGGVAATSGQGPGGQASSKERFGSKPGQGHQHTGRGGRSGGDRGHRHGQDSKPRHAKTIVVTSKKPRDPISQAMKEGDEPLRSFSDLLQFYEAKRTEEPGKLSQPQTQPDAAQENNSLDGLSPEPMTPEAIESESREPEPVQSDPE